MRKEWQKCRRCGNLVHMDEADRELFKWILAGGALEHPGPTHLKCHRLVKGPVYKEEKRA